MSRPRLLLPILVVFLVVACVNNTLIGRPTPMTGNTSTIRELTPTSNATASEEDVSIHFASEWKTDFSKHSVALGEIMSGGPPRDGIPPIDVPKFESFDQASDWLHDNEPVIALTFNGEARAYPLQILIWHEIVNDEVAGMPVAITFCPLCNTAIAFDRRVAGVGTLRFGTTGLLRNSDLIMWDDRTGSWWQQFTGQAIVGSLTGTALTTLPASITSYQDFRQTFPEGRVLSRDTGFTRDYGRNPYPGYDNVDQSPFLFNGKADARLTAMTRVVTVSLNGEAAAYPIFQLAQQRLAADQVGGQPIVLFWHPGTISALDQSSMSDSREIGSVGVFDPQLNGRELSFALANGEIRDRQTNSHWNVLGYAVSGPLIGQRLSPVVHGESFWFAWAAFMPNTRIWSP
ncbi:MAG TPA: DUF3179 domain-containing protein [Nitrolancea sp.]|nr:DUF3179 domain-containing protein [Nitrolancea sp.]